MSEENKVLVRRMFEEADRREEAPVELFARDFTAHIVGSPPMDLKAFQQFLAMWYATFSDFRHTFEDIVAEGDRVAIRVAVQATHTGEFMGPPATGKRISIVSTGIARIAEGQIAEWWNSPDRMGIMEQLDIIAALRATG